MELGNSNVEGLTIHWVVYLGSLVRLFLMSAHVPPRSLLAHLEGGSAGGDSQQIKFTRP